jgi:pyruvate, water dikinase
MGHDRKYIRWFTELRATDVPSVGGKNASLGEMVNVLHSAGVAVPDGFALTVDAYWAFITHNGLATQLRARLADLAQGRCALEEAGRDIRRLFRRSVFPPSVREELVDAYRLLSARYGEDDVDVAVRSSATAEDLPTASFAGQQESFLNVRGAEQLVEMCRRCFMSLFTDRAITYRDRMGFDHMRVGLSVGVQKMVRADKAGAGVMFTLDPETGFPNVVVISAAWGLGDNVVRGAVTPDEYRVFKPLLESPEVIPIIDKRVGDKGLTLVYAEGGSHRLENLNTPPERRASLVLDDARILQLARWGKAIEDHYRCAMDIEWAWDGESDRLFVVQARPETVHGQSKALQSFTLDRRGDVLVEGQAIGSAIARGKVFVLHDPSERDRLEPGGVLVTKMTDPSWVPLMGQTSAIVTDLGGRTSHAAIVSRELGVPAVVGTGSATRALSEGRTVTVSCAEGQTGYVYDGTLPYHVTDLELRDPPETRTRIMMIIASPQAAQRWWRVPCDGVGLARIEFIVSHLIRIHPMALLRPTDISDRAVRYEIDRVTAGFARKEEYFVQHLARGVAGIAATVYPHPAIVRFSDFKTNEYADLLGGAVFEPKEANPMLGFRGAVRYYSDRYRAAFALECEAIRRVREEMGLSNVIAMIPFCRTVDEADRVVSEMERNGLRRGRNGFELYMMCEVPSNVVLVEEFAERFDGFSIGSNDLTQLVLGVDRDSAELAPLFDERNAAVQRMIADFIERAHGQGRPVGICGQGPSDHTDFAEFLVRAGIDSIALTPDRLVEVRRRIATIEQGFGAKATAHGGHHVEANSRWSRKHG